MGEKHDTCSSLGANIHSDPDPKRVFKTDSTLYKIICSVVTKAIII